MSNVYGKTLLDEMVRQQGLPLTMVRQAAREILEVIREGLIEDGVVNVSNFGIFRLKEVAARKGFNPTTKQRITIPAHQRVIFTPCKALRELIQPHHQPPVPIPSDRPEPRAAARSAAIAPGGAVASKRIVPPPQTSEQREENIEVVTVLPPTVTTERRVTPDRRHTQSKVTTISPQELSTEVQKEADKQADTAEEIQLQMDEGPSSAERPNKGRYLGAAAILVIAAVTASLLYTSSTEEIPPAVIPHKSVAPVAAEIPPPSVSELVLQTEAVVTAMEKMDDSTLYTDMNQVQPEVEPFPTTPIAESSPAEAAKVTPAYPKPTKETTAEPTAPPSGEAVTTPMVKPASLFFSERLHTVASGESLWRLAKNHYHDPLLWPHIYQANAATIDNPDQLRVDKVIILPSLQGTPDKLSKTDRRNIAEGYYLTYLYYKRTGHKDAFFALLEAKRYDNKVVEEHRSLLELSKVEEVMLGQQETMPF